MLNQTRRLAAGREVKIVVAPDVREQVMDELPSGIKLKSGELHIEFVGAEDLLRRLFELSQAIANDYERFERLVVRALGS